MKNFDTVQEELAETTKSNQSVISLICQNSFDPAYGQKVISPKTKVFVECRDFNQSTKWDSVRIISEVGEFLGRISKQELLEKFTVA